MRHRISAGLLVAVLIGCATIPWLGTVAVERAVAAPAAPALAVGSDRAPVAAELDGSGSSDVLTPSAQLDSGVRSLPLFAEDGFVAKRFPGGEGLQDPDQVREAVRTLAARYGFGSPDELLPSEVSWSHDEYPYRYQPLDGIVERNLDREVVRTDPEGLVDLTSLLVVLSTLGEQPPGGLTEHSWASAAAYSLLDSARAELTSCDIQTNLAFVVGRGMSPDPATVRLEHDHAREICGDDPTVAWAWAKAAATLARADVDFRPIDRSPETRRREAERAFAELRRDFPDLPVGYAGHADLLLSWVEQTEAVNAQPFQRRAWAARAVELYTTARTVSADPRLLVGHARALAAVGRPELSLALLEQAETLRPGDLATSVLRTSVLSRLGRHAEAVEVIRDEAAAPLPWWLGFVQQDRPDHLVGAYAVEEFPPLSVVDVSLLEFGGAYVSDVSFVPRWRYPVPAGACRGAVLMRELLLSGDTIGLRAVLDDGLSPVDMIRGAQCQPEEETGFRWHDPGLWRLFADLADAPADQAGAVVSGASLSSSDMDSVHAVSEMFDHWQDVHRAAADYDEALHAADVWVETMPDDDRAWQRRGEVHYLAGDYEAALDDFTQALAAARRAQTAFDPTTWDPYGSYEADEQLDPYQQEVLITFQRGTTLEELDRPEEARQAYLDGLGALEDPWSPSLASSGQGFTAISDHLRVAGYSQLGTLDLSQERWTAAEEHLRQAVRIGREDTTYTGRVPLPNGGSRIEVTAGGPLSGAQESNLALALVERGRHHEAVPFAKAAVARDPANPVFLDNLGLALQQDGRTDAATRAYDRTVAVDATSFVAINNRAVARARAGDWERATAELLGLVRARPDYATGWHNLAVAWAHRRWSAPAFLRSQGAFSRAAEVNPGYRGAEPRLIVDRTAYDAQLDVSKPVPPDWEYGVAAAPTQQRLVWSLVVLLVLRVLWVLGLDQVGSWAVNRGLTRLSGGPGLLTGLRLPAAVALALSVVCVLGLSVVGTPGVGSLLVVTTLAALVTLPLVLRGLLARRRGVAVRHVTWSPALVAAAVATPAGFAFAPYPVVDGEAAAEVRGLLRWLPAAVVSATSAVFALVAWLSAVPLASLVAGSGLVLLTSILTPIAPMDGADLRRRGSQLLVTFLLGCGTVGVGLNWL